MMMYIIDGAIIRQEERTTAASLLIKGNEIRALAPSFPQMQCLRMDVHPFILTPAHAFHAALPDMPFPAFKSFFSEYFLLRGCNLALIPFTVQYESEFERELNRARTRLLNCPVDFLLGVEIPLRLLTPSLIRLCKKTKIPLVFVQLEEGCDLENPPWGWLREAAYPYNPVLIPAALTSAGRPAGKRLLRHWRSQLEKAKLPYHPEPLPECAPLPPAVLRKIGIYPKRGILRVGGEVSYNLYWKKDWDGQNPQPATAKPAISVDKGRFSAIGGKAVFRPGIGEEVIIQKTALFV